VNWAGQVVGRELVALLNQHQILVVPSRWEEPFGVVALEGIACGCVAIGSEGGGLKDAIGPCGATFPNGDSHALAAVLQRLLQNPRLRQAYRSKATEHLGRHSQASVAAAYLSLRACGSRWKRWTLGQHPNPP